MKDERIDPGRILPEGFVSELPSYCKHCEKMDLRESCEVIHFGADDIYQRTIYCANSNLCKALNKMLENEIKEGKEE